MHEKQLPGKEENDLSKLLLATTGLQQSSKDEPAVLAPWHLKLLVKHCASAATVNNAVDNEVQDTCLKKLICKHFDLTLVTQFNGNYCQQHMKPHSNGNFSCIRECKKQTRFPQAYCSKTT